MWERTLAEGYFFRFLRITQSGSFKYDPNTKFQKKCLNVEKNRAAFFPFFFKSVHAEDGVRK